MRQKDNALCKKNERHHERAEATKRLALAIDFAESTDYAANGLMENRKYREREREGWNQLFSDNSLPREWNRPWQEMFRLLFLGKMIASSF